MEEENKRNTLELIIEIIIGSIAVIGYVVYHVITFILNSIWILLPLVIIIVAPVLIAIFILIKIGVL
jgi:hypothetical protein